MKDAKYPLKDEKGNFLWKNLFKVDIMSVLFFIVVIFMVLGYNHDVEQYKEISEDPCGFCQNAISVCNYQNNPVADVQPAEVLEYPSGSN